MIAMVVNAEQIESVLFGGKGALKKLRPKSLIIVMSTVSPSFSRELGKRLSDAGHLFIDAPVSGGVVGAESGALSIMASGSDQAFAIGQPVLEAMATKIYRIGSEPGLGSVVKTVNQLLARPRLRPARGTRWLNCADRSAAEFGGLANGGPGAPALYRRRRHRPRLPGRRLHREALREPVRSIGQEGQLSLFAQGVRLSHHGINLGRALPRPGFEASPQRRGGLSATVQRLQWRLQDEGESSAGCARSFPALLSPRRTRKPKRFAHQAEAKL